MLEVELFQGRRTFPEAVVVFFRSVKLGRRDETVGVKAPLEPLFPAKDFTPGFLVNAPNHPHGLPFVEDQVLVDGRRGRVELVEVIDHRPFGIRGGGTQSVEAVVGVYNHVADETVVLGPARVVSHLEQRGVAFTVGRFRVVHRCEPFLHHVPAVGVPAVIDVQGGYALDKDIVLHHVVAAPANHDAAQRHPVEDVAEDGRAAAAVVEIHAPGLVRRLIAVHPVLVRPQPGEAEAVDVVKLVVPDDIAALGPVAAHVERAVVGAFHAHVVDVIELDDVLVAAKENRDVGRVVYQIVRHAVADAADVHAGLIGLVEFPEVVNVVVDCLVPAGCQCLAVTARKHNAAAAGVRDVVAQHAHAASALDADAELARIAHRALCHDGV